MATNPNPVPESWFKDYADGGYYSMLTLTDYIALRRSGQPVDSFEISF